MKRYARSSAAFTLVELLVVMAIIATLAGLAFPAIGGALKSAKKTQASAMLNNLKVAITAYNTEYGTWPLPASQTTDYEIKDTATWADLCKMLNGNKDVKTGVTVTPTTFTGNTRAMVFIEFNKKDLDSTTTYVADPTIAKAIADRTYRLWLDADYDNTIAVKLSNDVTDSPKDVNVNSGVAVYSRNEATTKNKALTTW